MDVEVHRKQRLRELMNHSCGGVIAVLAARMDRSESYVSRMLYPPDKTGAKPIADKMMRIIESAFGLDRAWLDMPLGEKLPGASTPDTSYSFVKEHTGPASPHGPRQVVWPFKLVTYSRIERIRKHFQGNRMPDAIGDIDSYLNVMVTRWENEITQRKSTA